MTPFSRHGGPPASSKKSKNMSSSPVTTPVQNRSMGFAPQTGDLADRKGKLLYRRIKKTLKTLPKSHPFRNDEWNRNVKKLGVFQSTEDELIKNFMLRDFCETMRFLQTCCIAQTNLVNLIQSKMKDKGEPIHGPFHESLWKQTQYLQRELSRIRNTFPLSLNMRRF